MYSAELFSIVKTTPGQYNPLPFKVHVLVNYHGVEEEAIFQFKNLASIPRSLFYIKSGKVFFKKGKQVRVSHPHEDATGLTFQYLICDELD